ncbi:MAG: RDD family protein [Treponema sp.]|nr:RDD family protein [Treponema sp.]
MNSKRIIAALIDYIITGILQAIFMINFMMLPLINNQLDFALIMPRVLSITYVSMMYLILRDILGSKSIGKRIIKLRIIDQATGNEAPFLKRIARNVPLFLAPIEIIVFLVTQHRLGDRLAGTAVLE